MTRKTEQYPWAWIAHHKLQYGENWPRVKHLFLPKKEAPMNPGG